VDGKAVDVLDAEAAASKSMAALCVGRLATEASVAVAHPDDMVAPYTIAARDRQRRC